MYCVYIIKNVNEVNRIDEALIYSLKTHHTFLTPPPGWELPLTSYRGHQGMRDSETRERKV
jgi:hypothetical protein